MSDVKKKDVAECSYYQGPNAIPGIKFRTAGKELGMTAWGMNVLEIDAGCTGHPEHDHIKDGEEEVYVVLRGNGTLQAGGSEWAIQAGSLIRVGPGEKRKIIPGAEGIAVLAIGATPGKVYDATT